jgi:hypothetical protein
MFRGEGSIAILRVEDQPKREILRAWAGKQVFFLVLCLVYSLCAALHRTALLTDVSADAR